ncbi:MAG TPA: molybdate ABC transporter substrate-binding protein [Acidimicrobiia bacterium]|nr:molybdate ABC transporter substrate-binding protein [Acidimicrobiia bacterium]
MRKLLVTPIVVAALAAGSAAAATARVGGAHEAKKPSGAVTVSAAASLTEAFTRIGTDFQRKYPGTTVRLNFGASSALELQIEQGAPADVFASADTATMDKLVNAGKATRPAKAFARNRLVIVTKRRNPEKIRTIRDLARVPTLSLCALTVPCGKYAAQMLQAAGVTIPESKITRGQDVKTTLAAVSPGDASAAVVYVSDAKAAGRSITTVTIPDAQNVIAVYPIATLPSSSNPATAKAFVRYVLSKPGQQVLQRDGFLPPAATQ